MDTLKQRVVQAVEASGAQMGVAIRHLEMGEEFTLNADTPVPLASVVKIPVLVEALRQISAGRMRLDDRWPLEHRYKALGSGILTLFDDNLEPTVRDLLTLMITVSDNTATDILIQFLGLEAIDSTMHVLGLPQTHVAHTLAELFADILPSADPDQDPYALARWEVEHGINRDGFTYSLGADNNVSTPREMNRLLEMIFKAELLDRAACDTMLAILLKQQYDDRLPRFLPFGTPIAHKTGTLDGIRNDCGIIYANAESHVAVSVLVTWDDDAVRGDRLAQWERYIAIDTAFGLIGRAAYDAYA